MKLNILGTEYEVVLQGEEENPKFKYADGLCEPYARKIFVADIKSDEKTIDNLDAYKDKVLRHEIIHAFLHESGLDGNTIDGWAKNEEMIDWFALQIPKIAQVYADMRKEQK